MKITKYVCDNCDREVYTKDMWFVRAQKGSSSERLDDGTALMKVKSFDLCDRCATQRRLPLEKSGNEHDE